MTPSLSIADNLICVHTIPYSFLTGTRIIPDGVSHKSGDFGAISVKRREAVPRRSLKWRVTYRIDVHILQDGFSCRHQSLSGIV